MMMMDSSTAAQKPSDKESMVDPFLVEALQNPRHRLTILRMELDVQRFLKAPELQHFEFQQFPTSYLRLAAHRVAQHYGLVTAVQETLDGQGNTIVVMKSTDSRYPPVCLSEIPAKHLESDNKSENIRVVLKTRPRNSGSPDNGAGAKRNPSKTVEDRKEEYERARARIFNSPGSSVSGDSSPVHVDGKDLGLNRNENELNRSFMNDSDKMYARESASRVAIIRDIEKDRVDPDYDRNYGRYVRSMPTEQIYGVMPIHMEKSALPYVQYGNGPCYPQYSLMPPRTHPSVNYGLPSGAVMTPFGAMGSNMGSTDAAYVQWPSHAMMYAQSYEQFRHVISQAPFCQQPPGLNYTQNLMNRS